MKETIKIVEVGPRDGLQNEKEIIPTTIKLEFIQRLVNAGLTTIEVTSFVSPKWVPQMADHEQIVAQLPILPNVRFPVLIPNSKGLETALRYPIQDIAVFAAASETFSHKNINRSISESLNDYAEIIHKAKSHKIRVRGYVSCALGCPYEGIITPSQVVKVAKALYSAGCDEISLGDTIGVGTPKSAQEMLKTVMSEVPISQLAIHFHDTYGQALANILACLELGVTIIDSAVGSLGGCPYAKGATGNVATEEVVYMLQGMGLKTGVSLDKLIDAGQYIGSQLKRPSRSKVAIAMLAKHSKGE